MYLHDHPALSRIPARHRKGCVALWAMAHSWSSRWSTNGFVPSGQVELLGGTEGEAALLVSSGLWEHHQNEEYEDGYMFRLWEQPATTQQAPVAAAEVLSPAERSRRYRARARDGKRDDRHEQRHGGVTASVTERDGKRDGSVTVGVTEDVTTVTVGGKGGSEFSPSDLSSLSGSPSLPGSESTQLAGCNAGAREEPPNPVRLKFELEELVRTEFFARGATPQKAPASQWRDGCQTVQDALQLGAYPDARTAMRAFATRLVDACAAGKPLGLALQQTPLGEQLRPPAPGGRQLSALALATLARRAEGT